MNIVITGANGFAGTYLIRELLGHYGDTAQLYGISDVNPTSESVCNLKNYAIVDITDYDALKKSLLLFKPDSIYHLAAQSSVALSFEKPHETFLVNQIGTLNVLDIAAKAFEKMPNILIVSSADLYEYSSGAMSEDTPFAPLNPYGVSKAAADYLGYMYWKNNNLPVIRVRSFNHIGPGQSIQFVLPDFARQIARIEKRYQKPELHVGNLDARRDFTDVRDIVRAYRMVVESAQPGSVYNVCSNKTYAIKELVTLLVEMSHVSITIKQDSKRMRPSDNPNLLGDNSKIAREIGWEPEISIEKTLEKLLHFWRKQVDLEYYKYV